MWFASFQNSFSLRNPFQVTIYLEIVIYQDLFGFQSIKICRSIAELVHSRNIGYMLFCRRLYDYFWKLCWIVSQGTSWRLYGSCRHKGCLSSGWYKIGDVVVDEVCSVDFFSTIEIASMSCSAVVMGQWLLWTKCLGISTRKRALSSGLVLRQKSMLNTAVDDTFKVTRRRMSWCWLKEQMYI